VAEQYLPEDLWHFTYTAYNEKTGFNYKAVYDQKYDFYSNFTGEYGVYYSSVQQYINTDRQMLHAIIFGAVPLLICMTLLLLCQCGVICKETRHPDLPLS
jgi:hypothetical protein